MHDLTVAQLAQGLRDKHFSSTELTEAYLARIDALDASLNAFVTVDAEGALAAAAAADRRLAAGTGDALTGVPMAHKDIFCTEGLRTSCGSRVLDNFAPPYDATVVRRLREAGAVMLGKTNLDEFAMGSSNENSRPETDLRSRVASWHGRLCLQPGLGGTHGADRRGLRPADERHGRP